MKILFKDFSGLDDLSQVFWTPKSFLLLLLRHDMTTMSFLSSEHLLWGLDFCPTQRAELQENIFQRGWSLTTNRGDSVDFPWAQWTFPSCCKYWAHHNSVCKLVLHPFSPLGIPQSWDGTAGKAAEKSHKEVQCLFQHQGKAKPFKGTLEDFKWVVKTLEVFEERTEQTLTLLWANTKILLGFGAACLEPGKNDSCNTKDTRAFC